MIGWAVHLLTAGGAACGLLALGAFADARLRDGFAWLGAALVIDGLDGALARSFDVARRVRSIDGALLDNLVDFLTYVVAPAFLVLRGELVPNGWGVGLALAVVMVSALQFAHREAKSADHLFRGFPSYWNIVVFYLVVLDVPRGWAAVVIACCCLMAVAPVHFVYPTRTVRLRRTTLAGAAAWFVCLAVLVVQLPDPSRSLALASLAFVVYYLATSVRETLERELRRPNRAE